MQQHDTIKKAPGKPGETPHWTTGAKSGVGRALSPASDICFSISHGIINEVYYPREDVVCVRQMGLIITDGNDFYSDESLHTNHQIEMQGAGIPAYNITNTCKQEKYSIKKEVIADPYRNVLLQRIQFKALQGNTDDYQVCIELAPHIKNKGGDNTGWVGDYKGQTMLFAKRDGITIAMAVSVPWKKVTVGYAGVSDGKTQLEADKKITEEYQQAANGNISMMGQLDLSQAQEDRFTIALGFGNSEAEAGHHAKASLLEGFDSAKEKYISDWQQWQDTLTDVKSDNDTIGKHFRQAAAVLRTCISKTFPGGIIASPSIPWGNARDDQDTGGYHIVWARDLVESAWSLLALNANEDALRVINYLVATQQPTGNWTQNMWLEGTPFHTGLQMDQVGLPLLLMNACYHRNLLTPEKLQRYKDCILNAASFILKNGPSTEQDRWERQPGISAFTIAAEIGALLAAAEFADIYGMGTFAGYCRDTADCWNDNIEKWTYVTGTSLAKQHDIEGYYIRINPQTTAIDEHKELTIIVRHHDGDTGKTPASEVICADALALVRFGLRAADDPRILNTIKVIDSQLKVETPNGPSWHRFSKDAYGEDEQGHPFQKLGKGRGWPLLTGERAHYEIAAGNVERAKELLKSIESFSNHYMIPEQIWDTTDIPEKELYFGKHTGSAMPLVWAHAEYIKLCYSIKNKKIIDLPGHTYDRYVKNKQECRYSCWRFTIPLEKIEKEILRIEVMAPAIIHWTNDNWQTKQESQARDTTTGVYVADIPVDKAADEIIFTFYWTEPNKWEGKNFRVRIK